MRNLSGSRVIRLVVFSSLLGVAEHADPYSCGDPSKNHCYGVNTWTQSTEYFGAYADITQVDMGCPSDCGGFVDDEIWLVDDSSADCKSNDFGMCWVEAGSIFTDGGHRIFFWSEGRAGTGNTFNQHFLGSADPVGTVDHYMLIKDGRTTPNPYQIFIYNDSQSTLYNGTSAVAGSGGCGSPPHQMSAKRIVIGQELAGTPPAGKEASAGNANFTRNIWAVQALDSGYVFWYNAQNAVGAVRSDSPPTASWTLSPGAPGAPEGGEFSTHCCQ